MEIKEKILTEQKRLLPGNNRLQIKFWICVLAFLVLGISLPSRAQNSTVFLDQLDLSNTDPQYSKVVKNKSYKGTNLQINGEKYVRGVGSQASSLLEILLDKNTERFVAEVGIDDATGNMGSIEVTVSGDGKELYKSGRVKGGDAPKKIDLEVKEVKVLTLFVSDAGSPWDVDLIAWGNARFEGVKKAPVFYRSPQPPAYVLTPAPRRAPEFHTPQQYGARPNAPFLYRLPVSGGRPMQLQIKGLPTGLNFNAEKGIISGKAPKAGTYKVKIAAKNQHGQANTTLHIIIGDKVALTPPMGWNSWNVWGNDINQDKIKRTAEAMISSGLADYGYSYINIDDTWQGSRGGKYNGLLADPVRFPDMPGLINYIHSLGLKVGIYSTPWKASYANRFGTSADLADGTVQKKEQKIGAHLFHEQDAKQWAEWGIDYLKYDWFPNDVKHAQEMMDALNRTGRDILLSLSPTTPFELAPEWARRVTLWRTTGDITDTWKSMSDIGFQQDKWAPYASPGHWNDPDMLVVGWLGWRDNTHLTRLTPTEQYTHVSLWSLVAAPLLLGCDLEKLDEFTLRLLTNPEVLAIDRDPLAKSARRVWAKGDLELWARPLADGSKAIGIFNRGEKAQIGTVNWQDLQFKGKKTVRDVWRQADIGKFENEYAVDIPAHGVAFVRIY